MLLPEEIIIVEDENGNIVRETMKDNAVLVQYRIMRETLVYLSHLDVFEICRRSAFFVTFCLGLVNCDVRNFVYRLSEVTFFLLRFQLNFL